MATRIARRMVTEFGMSPLGPIQYENDTGSVFLGRDYNSTQKNFSTQIAYEIDTQVRKIIEDAHEQARQFLEEHIEDVYLVTCNVCGVSHRHRGFLESEVERSRIFFLKRDTENDYNDKALKIAGESGFVIGYVPKEFSIILNNMIIANKYLYA